MGRTRRWRHSLYARSALFLLLGCGSLLGAVAVLSTVMVDESVERLLGERLDLARTAGAFLEHAVEADLAHLSARVQQTWHDGDGAPAVASALREEIATTVFSDGVFVLDLAGGTVVSVPDAAVHQAAAADLAALSHAALERDGVVASPLTRAGPRQVIVLLAPLAVRGRLRGLIGGLLQPASTNILAPLAEARQSHRAELDLVDGRGVIVASTSSHTLFRSGDHDQVLARSIAGRRDLTGRCHSCHEAEPHGVGQDAGGVTRFPQDAVMAFAPLPNLELGVAVHQPEDEALAPAFAVRRRMLLLGAAFVALFLLFAGLSVHSVVRPVKSLTQAVRDAESSETALGIRPMGHDEVGELASALETWRVRTLRSLAAVEHHRQALSRETESTRRHLRALEDIVGHATVELHVQAVVELGLHEAQSLLNADGGLLVVRHRTREFVASTLDHASQRIALLEQCAERFAQEKQAAREGPRELLHLALDGPDLERAGIHGAAGYAARLRTPPDFEALLLVLFDTKRPVDLRWLESLVHHISMSAANRVLREYDLERELHRRQYLHRVLKAQEGERRRVARELHDTLAQDLAALRLDLERLVGHTGDPALRQQLNQVEGRAQDMLVTVRRILLDLRLSVLESMGFLPALQWQLERVRQDTGLRGSLMVDGVERPLGYEMAVTLFRIFQESLQNVVQHAAAAHVIVTVIFGDVFVELMIEDDGHGFDPDEIPEKPVQERGLGLLGMEERARLLGGMMRITSAPDDGTTVYVYVPTGHEPHGLNAEREYDEPTDSHRSGR